jgi:ectoine hydroxylase-related dioxygenase (phytanoyl-CoA dioxygenase family)
MLDSKYEGHMDLFPAKIHLFKIDQKLINEALKGLTTRPKDFAYVEVFNDPHFKDLQEKVDCCSNTICPSTSRTGAWQVVSSWLNNQPPDHEGFEFHNHADAFMSAVLYLKGSKMSLSFRDSPKEAMNTSSSQKNFDIIIRHTWNDDVRLPVNAGDLLFFPSYLLHQPNKNNTKKDRISIAYNLMPSRKNAPNSSPWSMALDL